MKTKIYLGGTSEIQSINIKKIVITFTSGASVNDELEFDYFPFWPSTTNTPRVSLFKTTRVFSGEVTINPDPIQQAINYVTAFNLDYNSVGQFTVTRVDNVVTIIAANDSDLTNPTIIGSFATIVNPLETTVFDEYDLLDDFEDENIAFTAKLSDIEKLSSVFTDFTNSFTIPATPNNNQLFKHYYDVDIDNTFNANIRVKGYIEIDSFPFRYGKIQLEGIKLKDHRPDSYKITFYGGTIQITDLFGDDTIDKLDYDMTIVNNKKVFTKVRSDLSQFDYPYNSTNFSNSINLPSFKDGNVITPLISYTDRDWNYGSANVLDISSNTGAILGSELRPALRVMNIFNAIESKYNISFSKNFFSKAQFNNLFIWLNRQTEGIEGRKETLLITTPLTGTPDAGNVQLLDNYVYITRRKEKPYVGAGFEARIDYLVTPTDNYQYSAYLIDENDNIVAQWLNRTGIQTFSKNWVATPGKSDRLVTEQVKLVIAASQSNVFTVNVRVRYNRGFIALTDLSSNGNVTTIPVEMLISENLPSMKVIDFFQGIMKMFKLIIRPLSGNQFYINTLDGYYSEGNLLDMTSFVDNNQVNIERPLIYRDISFKFQKTNNVAGKQFRIQNDPTDDIGYGDLKVRYSNIDDKSELKVELPFENMLFERMTVLQPSANAGSITDIVIGQSISTTNNITFSKNNSKPILFYNNGIVNSADFPIKIKFREDIGAFSYFYLIGNTNDEVLDQVTDTINWGAEIDPWHQTVVSNSLYQNHWSNWINTIYSLKQRKFTFTKAILPPRFVEELSLNDRLVIGDQRYKINDYTINLTNGETKFTLFKDIYENFNNPEPDFNGKVFAPAGMYLVDYTKANDRGSYWLYGSFTSYDGETATRVIKLNEDGTQDKTFLTNLGGPNSNPFALVTLAPYSDGRLLVGGFFTQYNGTARNRIARLNPNGTLDTTFSIGTGFNSSTQKILLQSDNKILVTGAFSSYNGTARNRIARLNPNGTIDTSFTIGTGFNNVTLDAISNQDGSYYVAGYFTQYNGATANHVAKIGATGSIDNTFTTGATAFSPGGNNRVIGLLQDPNSTSFWVYGYDFTSYQGATAGRIIKLTNTGSKDISFDAGTGFNNSVVSLRLTDSGNLFAGGAFTTYNGISTQKAVIISQSGDIVQTFSQTGLNNHYVIGDDVYANEASTGQLVKLTTQNGLALSRNFITFNAGSKYFGFTLFSDGDWTITKVDDGFGTSWLDVLTPSGSKSSSIELFCQEKASQTPPAVYLPRTMYLKCVSGTNEKWIRIVQFGLQA
jgi:uncharacterized delta-60 repeat protein